MSLLSRLYRAFAQAAVPGTEPRSRDLTLLYSSASEQQLYSSTEAISHGIQMLQANGNCGLVSGALITQLWFPVNQSERR